MADVYKDIIITQVAPGIPVLKAGDIYIGLDLSDSVWTVEETGEGEYTATVAIGDFTLELTADVDDTDGVITIDNLVYTATVADGD